MPSPSPAREFETPLFPYPASFQAVSLPGIGEAELSFVEAGPPDGSPVVLLHGNPTWSFLYRHIIPLLSEAGLRSVAVDFLGFGRSDKLDRFEDYTLANHLEALSQLFEARDLSNVTLVVHDWAGPIGLSYAVDHLERIDRLVILNTWAFAPKSHNKVPQPLKTFRTWPLGELLVLGLNGFVNVVLPYGVVRRERLKGAPMKAYKAPFPTWRSRWPVLAFPKHIPLSEEDEAYQRMAATDEALRSFDKPVIILWAEQDPVFPPRVIRKFEERLPRVERVVRYEDASHFLQEDVPMELAGEMVEFVG